MSTRDAGQDGREFDAESKSAVASERSSVTRSETAIFLALSRASTPYNKPLNLTESWRS